MTTYRSSAKKYLPEIGAFYLNCPRCSRVGVVSKIADGSLPYAITWLPRVAGPFEARDPDYDTSISVADLRNPEFGCGYDFSTGGPK